MPDRRNNLSADIGQQTSVYIFVRRHVISEQCSSELRRGRRPTGSVCGAHDLVIVFLRVERNEVGFMS
jgi:hypothetical protein